MSGRLKIVLGLSHLVLVGLGAWWGNADSAPEENQVAASNRSGRKPVDRGYQISPDRILAALRPDSPFFPQGNSEPGNPKRRTPEERAAEVVDFRREMQSQVEVFNQTGFTDYRFTREVIYRWMALNPREAMDFFARVEIRSGWGDPWPALFKNPSGMSGIELATHIENHWLSENRRRGLKALASSVGRNDPGQLPAILELLKNDPRTSQEFFSEALNVARAGDFSFWFELTSNLERSKQQEVFRKLADRMIPSRVPPTWFDPGVNTYGRESPSRGDLEAILAEAKGTAAEGAFRERMNNLLATFEKLKIEKADSANRTEHENISSSPGSYQLEQEIEGSRTTEMRSVVRGEQSMSMALENHLSMVERSLEEGKRSNETRRVMSEAMLLDPVATFEFGRNRYSDEEMSRYFNMTNDDNIYSVRARSEMLNQLFDTPYWERVPDRVDYLSETMRGYRDHHVEQAAAWARSLPEAIVEEIGKDQRQSELVRYLEEVRTK